MKRLSLAILLFIQAYSFAAQSEQVFQQMNESLYLAGENHKQDQIRAEFSKDLEIFVTKGGKVLALEMVESKYQYLLNEYLDDAPESEVELYKYLKRRWGYNTSSYMDMIKKAKSLGLDLLAVDLPKEFWPKEVMLYPVPPDMSLVRAAREAHMAKVLCKEFRKTVLIIGSFHILERFLPSALKKECFKMSYSFRL